MFSGIIEAAGTVVSARKDRENLVLEIRCPFTSELKPDQSLAHDGVCLTVTSVNGDMYRVTAVKETLDRTNLGRLKPGDPVNLERSVKAGDRLDGHVVQGHVDCTGNCELTEDMNGSRKYWFVHDPSYVTVSKGSVSVNGVSLTVADSSPGRFSVVIIPHTSEKTNFRTLKEGDKVNLEFDILGKYVEKILRGS